MMRTITMLIVVLTFITIAAGTEMKEQEITVKLTVPDVGWKIYIEEIYCVEGELWVICRLDRPPVMAAQIISTVSDTIKVKTPDLVTKYFVLGKTWRWRNNEPYTLNNRNLRDDRLTIHFS